MGAGELGSRRLLMIGDSMSAAEGSGLSGTAFLHQPSLEGPQQGKGDKVLLKSQTSNVFDQLPINSSHQQPRHPSQSGGAEAEVGVDCTGGVCLRLLGDMATCLARRQAPKSS